MMLNLFKAKRALCPLWEKIQHDVKFNACSISNWCLHNFFIKYSKRRWLQKLRHRFITMFMLGPAESHHILEYITDAICILIYMKTLGIYIGYWSWRNQLNKLPAVITCKYCKECLECYKNTFLSVILLVFDKNFSAWKLFWR